LSSEGFDNSGLFQYRKREVLMRLLAICLAASVLACSGCSRTDTLHSKEAVKAAIEAHLQQRAGVMYSSMTIEVQDVKFSGDTALVQATFRSKDSPQIAVGVNYQLHRAGDHWEVERSTPAGGMGASPHGAGSTTQPPVPTPQSSH
jgi:hypothetical protein